jgi:iron complex outermembrane receptor protein
MLFEVKSSLRICVFLISVLLVSTNNCFAQTLPDTLQLQEFELISNRNNTTLTFQKSNIDTLRKQELNHLDLGELLATGSPVYVKSYGKGSLSTASIRGAGASHTQVFWNGFSINSPMLGQVDLSQVPINFVDDVGLLYGGNSLLQSGGALGGSVVLNNRSFRPDDPMLSIEQVFGSFHSYVTAVNLNLNYEKFGSDTRVIFQKSQNDFEYFNNGILPSEWMTQKNAAFRNFGFTQQFSYIPVRYHFISFITWNQWNNREIPPIMTNVQKGGNPEEYQQDFFSRNVLTWNYNKGATFFELKTAFFTEDQHYFLQTTTNDADAEIVKQIDSKNLNNGFISKAKLVQELSRGFQLTAGADLSMNNVQSSNYTGTKKRNTSAVFVMFDKNILNRLNISFLLRLEMADQDLLPLMPMLGFNYQLMKNEQLFINASVSKNYNLPSLNDLYWYPGGNEDLKAESGVEVEGSIRYSKLFQNSIRLSAGLTSYFSWIKDWIQWTPSDYRYWTPENISDVYARGLEASFNFSGNIGKLNYKILSGYSFTRTTIESPVAKIEGFSGTQLIYIPVHSANALFYGNLKGYFASWGLNYIGQRTTTMDAEKNYSNTLPAYLLHNFSLGKGFPFQKFGLELRFKINNVFDVEYQSIQWRPMPGRNYEFFIKINLN